MSVANDPTSPQTEDGRPVGKYSFLIATYPLFIGLRNCQAVDLSLARKSDAESD